MIWLKFYVSGLLEYFLRLLVFPLLSKFREEHGAFYAQGGFPVEHIRDFGVSRFKAGSIRMLGLSSRLPDKKEKQEEQCFVHVAEWAILVVKDNT